MRKALSLILALALTAVVAHADITYDFVKIATPNIDGQDYNVWEMRVECTTDWTNARLDVNLTDGEMFASPFGVTQEPTSGLKAALQDLEYDTWLTVPGGGGVDQVPMVQAGEIIMPTAAGQKTQIGASWGNTDTTDIGIFSIAQITLTPDALGSIEARAYDVASAGVGVPLDGYSIEGGNILPEPATLALLAIGLPLLGRRKTSGRV